MKTEFYSCGDEAAVVYGNVCAFGQMKLLTANTSDGAGEKHLPVVERNGDEATVRAGSVAHPSTTEHFISMLALETDKGLHVTHLCPESSPSARFRLCGEKPVAAYAFCNLHGLWKTEL